MLLTNILRDLTYTIVKDNLQQEISGIAFNSKDVRKGNIFVCITGFSVDGHDMVDEAIDKGASVIIIEKDVQVSRDVTILKVSNTRNALAKIAANFYEHPTDNINVIGITGTNGKTSITHFIKSILDEAKQSVGIIGTMGTLINDEAIPTQNTTPESLDLQHFFAEMEKSGVDSCLIEVSSHALALDRVAYTKFNTGIFTNLTPDHLELHKNMEEYFEAKAMLFQMTEEFNIINADDFYGQKLIERLKNNDVKTITYGIHEKCDFYATNIEYRFNQTSYTLHTPFETAEITIHLPGEIYVANSLAAIAAAYSNGIKIEAIKRGLKKVTTIAGRFEVVYEKDDFKVIVDFAHTEDALQKTLSILKPFVKGKIILVFGVYADMSENGKEKRYGMGRVAAEYADFSVVTLDNPKHNDVNQIINETTESIIRNKGKYIAIPDRKEAIRYAIEISEENDFILLAGKGHERTQVIGDKEFTFSEKDIVKEAMKEKIFD